MLNFEIWKLTDTYSHKLGFFFRKTYLEQTLAVLHTFLPGFLQFLEEEKSRLYYAKVCVSAIPLGLFLTGFFLKKKLQIYKVYKYSLNIFSYLKDLKPKKKGLGIMKF